MSITQTIHNDLLSLQNRVFDKHGFKYTTPLMEEESKEYAAYLFELNSLAVRFRVSKITPTKVGQFVTIWKRKGNGPIEPFDITDKLDIVIISARTETHFGHFVFPKAVLCKQGIITVNDKEGKRAMRVYPPWDIATNKQAQKTQKWQLNYFIDLSNINAIDSLRLKRLYNQE
jgi:hypothetical protein